MLCETSDRPRERQRVICVDLDGTLILTDTLLELFLRLLKHAPHLFCLVPFWLLFKGKAYLKSKLARQWAGYIKNVPFNTALINWLRKEKAAGATLYLATACEENMAKNIVAEWGLFEAVFGSTASNNLRSAQKAALLVAKFGEQGFAYAGNATADLPVWKHAAEVIVVNACPRVLAKAKAQNPNKPLVVIPPPSRTIKAFLRTIRIHQWSKNLLIFIPLILSHTYGEFPRLINALIAFFAFSLFASATYIINDFCDIEADRAHAEKKNRPLASGKISIPVSAVIFIVFMLLAIGLMSLLPQGTFLLALAYLVLTLTYSFSLKRAVLIDVIALSILYILRIYFGAIAVDVPVSFWLVSFSIFIFLSLGFLKRYVELKATPATGHNLAGRGYRTSDLEIIAPMGIAAGVVSVLVYIIYIDRFAANFYEAHINLMWGSIVFLYFICKLWIAAGRGMVTSDPIVYSLKNKENYVLLIIFFVLFLLAKPIMAG